MLRQPLEKQNRSLINTAVFPITVLMYISSKYLWTGLRRTRTKNTHTPIFSAGGGSPSFVLLLLSRGEEPRQHLLGNARNPLRSSLWPLNVLLYKPPRTFGMFGDRNPAPFPPTPPAPGSFRSSQLRQNTASFPHDLGSKPTGLLRMVDASIREVAIKGCTSSFEGRSNSDALQRYTGQTMPAQKANTL